MIGNSIIVINNLKQIIANYAALQNNSLVATKTSAYNFFFLATTFNVYLIS